MIQQCRGCSASTTLCHCEVPTRDGPTVVLGEQNRDTNCSTGHCSAARQPPRGAALDIGACLLSSCRRELEGEVLTPTPVLCGPRRSFRGRSRPTAASNTRSRPDACVGCLRRHGTTRSWRSGDSTSSTSCSGSWRCCCPGQPAQCCRRRHGSRRPGSRRRGVRDARACLGHKCSVATLPQSENHTMHRHIRRRDCPTARGRARPLPDRDAAVRRCGTVPPAPVH